MSCLDYDRLIQLLDTELYRFLITVNHTSTKRRCRVAFPEFFSEKQIPASILWSDIIERYQAVSQSTADDWETEFDETFNWFGIPVTKFEYREDGIEQKDYRLLPQSQTLERDHDYDGITSDNQWRISVPLQKTNGPAGEEEHLVLKVIITSEMNPTFFLWTIPTRYIIFEDE